MMNHWLDPWNLSLYAPTPKKRKVDPQSIKDFIHLPWTEACEQRNFDIIRHLVEHDLTSINHQNYKGTTLLMIAAADNLDARGARLLHESGAKTDICDNEGRMALHFAAESGNIELLEYILQHTEQSSIEKWFLNIPNILQARGTLHSLVKCAIQSKNVKCLELLLTSNKLYKSILQAPFITKDYTNACIIHSPLTYVFNCIHLSRDKQNSFSKLLLKHKIMKLDKFFAVLKIKYPYPRIKFQSPFSKIFNNRRSLPLQKHQFKWLNDNDVTIDYCLECYHDNTQPFATFTNYNQYYEPVMDVVSSNNIEALKLIMSSSAILEPDELIIQFSPKMYRLPTFFVWPYVRSRRTNPFFGRTSEDRKNIFKYLISLKPIYYKRDQLPIETGQDEFSWYPYSTIGEEFSQTTLQQLCRTTIRHNIRKYTLKDNLCDFRNDILELSLPIPLKKFLLFEN